MARFMDMFIKVECTKCKTTVKRTESKQVSVGPRVYTLCNDCSWELEGWLHKMPITKVSSLPIEVVEEKVEAKTEGAE